MTECFTGSFTQQEPIPEAGIAAAIEVMRSGRLHRYNLGPGEIGEVGLLEQEFAAIVGAKYALAVASGGYAMGCALRALGIGPGDKVLTNAFTLAPVPGAIASVNAEPVLVEITEDLVLDLADLEAKAQASGARVLMLSHMRGHLVDMEALVALCDRIGVTIVEDCAHTMGAAWNGKASGTFGAVGCFSMQTYKHINSGEGGLIVTDDAELAARMIILSGSYMLYERHGARPPMEAFEQARIDMPNVSGRMDHLRAAILRPQLANLPLQVTRWAERYRMLEAGLAGTPGLHVAPRPEAETFVGSSIQFTLPEATAEHIRDFVARCAARGVELKWFGAEAPVGFTSRHSHWGYVTPQQLPQTDRILAGLLDMRVPLTFSLEDCALIARIIDDEARAPLSMAAE
jgi:dTDP-4-amino-4,6-dideoxygalactose transaminase